MSDHFRRRLSDKLGYLLKNDPDNFWHDKGDPATMPLDDFRHYLDVQISENLIGSLITGKPKEKIRVPRAVAERMLADLTAQLKGQPRRARGRQNASAVQRSFEILAIEQLRPRARELRKQNNITPEEAIERAAVQLKDELKLPIAASTLIRRAKSARK